MLPRQQLGVDSPRYHLNLMHRNTFAFMQSKSLLTEGTPLLQFTQGFAQLRHFTCNDSTGGETANGSSLGRKRAARTPDAVGQVGELLGVVQHLHALGVGVVAQREGLRDGRRKFPVEQADGQARAVLHPPLPGPRQSLPHFVFGIFEAVGNKVNGLVLGDGVLLEAGLVGVKGQDLGLVRQAVLQRKSPEKQQASQQHR